MKFKYYILRLNAGMTPDQYYGTTVIQAVKTKKEAVTYCNTLLKNKTHVDSLLIVKAITSFQLDTKTFKEVTA